MAVGLSEDIFRGIDLACDSEVGQPAFHWSFFDESLFKVQKAVFKTTYFDYLFAELNYKRLKFAMYTVKSSIKVTIFERFKRIVFEVDKPILHFLF